MFFLIGGVRPRVRASGERRAGRCSRCGSDQLFERVRIRPYLEIFFVPLLPLGADEVAWRCASCQTLRADTGERPIEGDDTVNAGGSGVRGGGERSGRAVPAKWPDVSGQASPLGGPAIEIRRPVAPRYCHHCGARIEASPNEGRAAGFRRYHCEQCGRDFEVGP